MKTLNLKRYQCHACSTWTALNGCTHHGPQDYDKNRSIIDEIVAATHHKYNVVETGDFYAGVNATLIYLRQNNLLK